jgi:hypothetical protein
MTRDIGKIILINYRLVKRMQIKTFKDIDITNPAPPYFQVNDSQRIRFGWTVLEENPGMLKRIFKSLKLEKQTKVDGTFLSAYESEGFKQKESSI